MEKDIKIDILDTYSIMADGVKVSRGNPRASSVGEEEDVDEIRYRSTSKIDALDIVDIEDCGIVLDCSSPGDSFEPQDPCDNLHLNFYNVMGQEDKFRHDGDERVQRGGIARIITTTNEEADVDIDYVSDPQDKDSPTFNVNKSGVSQGKKYHEFFLGVSPSTLYAFKITATSSDCPDTTEESGIYYFKTGDTIQIKFVNFRALSIQEVFESVIEEMIITSLGSASFKGTIDPTLFSGLTFGPQTENIPSGDINSLTESASSFSTSFTTS